jgi:hypothetical protein
MPDNSFEPRPGSRPPYTGEQLELVLDQLADILDQAALQAERTPDLQHLSPVIRRSFEGIKVLVRRLERDLLPLESA